MDIFVTIYRVMVKYYFADFFCKALTHPPFKGYNFNEYSIDKNVQEKAAKSDRVLVRKVEVHNSFEDVTSSNR